TSPGRPRRNKASSRCCTSASSRRSRLSADSSSAIICFRTLVSSGSLAGSKTVAVGVADGEAGAAEGDRGVVASVLMQDETPQDAKGSASKAGFLKIKTTRRHGESFAAWAAV